MTYHKHVDGLRCLAVMVVFLMHLNVPGFQGGFVGVDVFFVISGFLISGLIMEEMERTNRFSFLSFYCRRVQRILPALLFTILLTFVAAMLILQQGAFLNFGRSVVSGVFAVSNVFFYHQMGYFNIFSQKSALLHTWSLGVEEQFYLIWPLALLAVFRWARGNKQRAFAWLFIVIFVLSLAANLLEQHHDLDRLYYVTYYRAFEFCVGALLALWVKSGEIKNKKVAELMAGLGLVMIATSVYVYQPGMPFPTYYGLLPTLGAACLIAASNSVYLASVFRWYPIRYVGLISYSLYLIHWPLIVFVKMAHYSLYGNNVLSMCFKVALVFIAVAIAHLMYRYIEQPFRKKIPALKGKVKVLLVAACVALPVAALGYSTRFLSLWEWRLAGDAVHVDLSNYHKTHWGGAGFDSGYLYHGKTKSPMLVVYGDSHASMLARGLLDKFSKPNNVTTYMVSGAFNKQGYMSGVALPGLTREYTGKQAAADQSVQKQLNDMLLVLGKRDDSTLLIAFSYFDQYSMMMHLNNHQRLGIDFKHSTNAVEYAPFLEALDRLRVLISPRRLIILGGVPQSVYQPYQCMRPVRWLFRFSKCPKRDKVNRLLANVNANTVLAAYAAKHDKVVFINPYDSFCNGGYCDSLSANGVPFYSDGRHLSKEGSRYLVSHIAQRINDFVKPKKRGPKASLYLELC